MQLDLVGCTALKDDNATGNMVVKKSASKATGTPATRSGAVSTGSPNNRGLSRIPGRCTNDNDCKTNTDDPYPKCNFVSHTCQFNDGYVGGKCENKTLSTSPGMPAVTAYLCKNGPDTVCNNNQICEYTDKMKISIGQSCQKNSDCATYFCNNNSNGQVICMMQYSKKSGETCSVNKECASSLCGINHKCLNPNTKKSGETCVQTDECKQGLYCLNNKCKAKKGTTELCNAPEECLSGICTDNSCIRSQPGDLGEPCTHDSECKNNLQCNNQRGICGYIYGHTCDDDGKEYSRREYGSRDIGDKKCASGNCDFVFSAGTYPLVCVAKKNSISMGQSCKASSECEFRQLTYVDTYPSVSVHNGYYQLSCGFTHTCLIPAFFECKKDIDCDNQKCGTSYDTDLKTCRNGA